MRRDFPIIEEVISDVYGAAYARLSLWYLSIISINLSAVMDA